MCCVHPGQTGTKLLHRNAGWGAQQAERSRPPKPRRGGGGDRASRGKARAQTKARYAPGREARGLLSWRHAPDAGVCRHMLCHWFPSPCGGALKTKEPSRLAVLCWGRQGQLPDLTPPRCAVTSLWASTRPQGGGGVESLAAWNTVHQGFASPLSRGWVVKHLLAGFKPDKMI